MSVLTRFQLFCAYNDEPKTVSRTFSGNVAEANGDWPSWKAPDRGVKDGDGKTASHHARFRGGEKRSAETHEEAPRLIQNQLYGCESARTLMCPQMQM